MNGLKGREQNLYSFCFAQELLKASDSSKPKHSSMPMPVLGAGVEGFFIQAALITVAEFTMHCRMLDHTLFTFEVYQHHPRSAPSSPQWTASCHKGVPCTATGLQPAQCKDKATGNKIFQCNTRNRLLQGPCTLFP